MDEDDVPAGRLLTRRETLTLLGWAGAAVWLGACPRDARALLDASPLTLATARPCVVRPEQTEGPYFVDEELERGDIRKDPASGVLKPGTPLTIQFNVSRVVNGQCRPLPNARVDVWHCDAAGLYSDVRDFNGDTRGQKYLRGHQVTGESGAATFTTIYPGWYPGRSVHIHFKVRSDAGERRGDEFTSQLYFDDTLSDRVYRSAPYASHSGRRTRNERDGIFRDGGDRLTLTPKAQGAGYAATFDLALESA